MALQMYAHLDTHPFKKHYAKFECTYIPGKYEHLEDAPIKTSIMVSLLWRVKKPIPPNLVIPDVYFLLDHPANLKNKKYQELEYRVHNTELTIEFHFQVLSEWCSTGEKVLIRREGAIHVCRIEDFDCLSGRS